MSVQSFLIKAIGNNGTPELINIDKSGSNKSAIKIYNKRSFTDIEIVQMIKKEQLNTQERSMFKSFYSLAA